MRIYTSFVWGGVSEYEKRGVAKYKDRNIIKD
jgi:hypothetical protein